MNLLTIEHLTKAYTERKLFDDTDFSIQEGDKIGIIGINGTGKSTLLKILAGREEPDAGKVTKGNKVQIRFLTQQQTFPDHMTALEAVMEGNQNEWNAWTLESDAKTMLNQLKVPNFDQPMSELSGGQKKRVALAQVLLSEADILILDEPTNHLDITSKEILESALNQYTGTVFFVSHDRYFINQTATRILDLTGGTIVNYIGNYDYYLEKHDELTRIYVEAEPKAQAAQMTEQTVAQDGSGTDKKADWQAQKAEQARIRKLENTLKKAEERIAELEDLIAGIDEECADPANATNSAKLGELTGRQNEYRSELEKCYEEWEQVSMELES